MYTICIYIYMYREREIFVSYIYIYMFVCTYMQRERDVYIYIYMYMYICIKHNARCGSTQPIVPITQFKSQIRYQHSSGISFTNTYPDIIYLKRNSFIQMRPRLLVYYTTTYCTRVRHNIIDILCIYIYIYIYIIYQLYYVVPSYSTL